MIYYYKGLHGCDSKCDIEVKGNIVIAKELKENSGTSITNWAENLANDITKMYGIKKEKLVWLECYEYSGHYAIVEFEIKSNSFVNPNWTQCSKETIRKIVSGEIKIK